MKKLRRQIQQARISMNNQFWQSRERQFQLAKLEKNFQHMINAFNLNQRLQQTYLNIMKGKIQVKASSMQTIYKLLSQNKTSEIIFQKFSQEQLLNLKLKEQCEKAACSSLKPESHKSTLINKMKNSKHQYSPLQQQSTKENQQFTQNIHQKQIQQQEQQKKIFGLDRLYSRLAEKMFAKITFYILRKHYVPFIAPLVLEQSKRLQILMRRINDLKDLRFFYQFIDKIYEENSIFQEKIYKQIVQKGYVLSLQQFYRVNGILQVQQRISVKRSSRMSGITNSRQSISSSQNNTEKQFTQMRTLSKLKQQKTKDKKQNQIDKRNAIFITRINKQIQCKYTDLLDKVSDYIQAKKAQNIHTKEDQQIQAIQQSLSSIQSDEDQGPRNIDDKNRLFRFREAQKPARVKSNEHQFKYFSSQFSKIIKNLDNKKGKTFKKNSGQDPFGQTLTVNSDAIAYKNPQTIAKLLMSGFNLGDNFKTTKTVQKDKNYSVKRLLKLYQARNAQNNIIDMMLSSNIPQIQAQIPIHKRPSQRYSNINIGMLRKLDGLVQLRKSHRQRPQQSDLVYVEKGNRKKLNLKQLQGPSRIQSQTQRFYISQSASKICCKSSRQQIQQQSTKINLQQNLKKSNFYTTPEQVKQSESKKKPSADRNSLKKCQENQRQIFCSDKIIKLLRQKTVFGSSNVYNNPLNQGYGFYSDKAYNTIKKNMQKRQKKFQILQKSSSNTFINNTLIKKGLFKVIQQKQVQNTSIKQQCQKNISKNKFDIQLAQVKNKKLNAHQKFIRKHKIIKNDINLIFKNQAISDANQRKIKPMHHFIRNSQRSSEIQRKYQRRTHAVLKQNRDQNQLNESNDKSKYVAHNFTTFDYKYKSQTSSFYEADKDLPLIVNSTSISVSPAVSPQLRYQEQQNKIISQLEKDMMRLQKSNQQIRAKKLSLFTGKIAKNKKQILSDNVYSIYSTNLRKIIS